MDFIEVSAKTVDEAITKASIQMETSSDNLDIEVVSEGSAGFLGLGSKDAVIRVKRKTNNDEILEETDSKTLKKAEKASKKVDKKEVKTIKKEVKSDEIDAKPKKVQVERQREAPVIRTEEEIVDIKQLSQDFLGRVFTAMEVPVKIVVEYDNTESNLNVDFTGEDMGILIGKRGQTLDSLQYLTSLVVNKNREGYIRVKLDTENYRTRRKDTLESLAKNIAFKVKKTRRPVSLEPMNPYERRIIHSSLQGNNAVETFSEGNEPYRHVVISLKK